MTIALIDYGAGNLHSVHNALRKAGAQDVAITADADLVARADRIVLPGVGAFRACRDALVAIPGTVRLVERADPAIKIPHMGWNDVTLTGAAGLLEPGEAYFLHSYHFEAADPAHVAAVTDHGGPLVAAVARDTIIGCQFHPEKSQRYGLSFLARFLDWRP